MQVLDTYNLRPEDDSPLLYHRITEAFKWAFALRTQLGDAAGDPDIAARVEEVECSASKSSIRSKSEGSAIRHYANQPARPL